MLLRDSRLVKKSVLVVKPQVQVFLHEIDIGVLEVRGHIFGLVLVELVGNDLYIPHVVLGDGGNDGIFLIDGIVLLIVHAQPPHLALGALEHLLGRTSEGYFAFVQQGHIVARAGYIAHDVR